MEAEEPCEGQGASSPLACRQRSEIRPVGEGDPRVDRPAPHEAVRRGMAAHDRTPGMTPFAPPHPCAYPGCHTLVRGASRCERHRRREETSARRGPRRPSASSQGYGARWRKARESFLADHQFCEVCGRQATEVDHRKAHHGDPDLFWDQTNWQALCKACHSRKTAREDRRWGARIRRPSLRMEFGAGDGNR